MRIALAGNPNSGKTTVYNGLTGKNEKTGNWAGVTVEHKVASLKSSLSNESVMIVDLPGTYSLTSYTLEEAITSEYIQKQEIDVIINIVDASQLSRSLFLTTQLMELGVPIVIALNKADLNIKNHIHINIDLLSKKLGCPIVMTNALKGEGFVELIASAISSKHNNNDFKQMGSKQERYDYINKIVEQVETREKDDMLSFQDRLDRLLTHKFLGIVLFAFVMFLVFDLSQTHIGPYIADVLVGWIEVFKEFVASLIDGSSLILQTLILDGIIDGVGAVIGFLPLVMVMYFLIALLEDCGYMARVSVIMDPIFKKVGLSGKSIIPMIIGTGCSIPGIMACRTIKNERERRTTAMLTPFMPCGAKLPVIALFSGVFFQNAAWIGTLMYFVGIAFVFLGALLVLKINGQKYQQSFFIIELPEYKIPSLKLAIVSMLSRGKAYIIKAGTIILVCNVAVKIMQMFNWNFEVVPVGMEHTSILASIASPLAFLLIPLGFGVWQLAAAAITGLIAKENVVGTLAIVYGLTRFIDVDALELVGGASEVATTMGISAVAALAYLMFNLFTPPCFAAIGAMNAEMQDKKWLFGGIALQFATGYIVAFIVYQVGTLITTQQMGDGFVFGLLVVMCIVAIIIHLIRKAQHE